MLCDVESQQMLSTDVLTGCLELGRVLLWSLSFTCADLTNGFSQFCLVYKSESKLFLEYLTSQILHGYGQL